MGDAMKSTNDVALTAVFTPQALADDTACIDLIAQTQRRTGERCLHSDFDVTANTYRAESAEEALYAASYRDASSNKPSSILGAEIADELGRAWLRGPFFAADADGDWSVLASAAFDALRAAAKQRARTWDAFVETSHHRAREWYEARGFVQKAQHSIYTVDQDRARYQPEPEVRVPRTDAEIDAIDALASQSFPGGYLTRASFAAPPSDESITLMIADENGMLGYIYASYEPGAVEAQIDNLAVTPHARRRGIGRKLLHAALAWAIEKRAAPQVALVVRDGNVNARALYSSVGFSLLADGVHLRLELA